MRISINLASRPFIELRPLFARLRLAMAALALVAIALGFVLHGVAGHERQAEAQMNALKAQTTAVENERFANEGRMRQPQNRAVLDRSRFLNQLFAEKSFSWTTVMMDLERVLPAGVQVVNIEPVVTSDGDVSIRLRVTGDRDRAVQLVRNLERSRRYIAPRLANETAQTQQEGQGRVVPTAGGAAPAGVQFDIVSGYNPLAVESKPTVTAPQKAGTPGAAANKLTLPKKAPSKPATTPQPGGVR